MLDPDDVQRSINSGAFIISDDNNATIECINDYVLKKETIVVKGSSIFFNSAAII